MQAFISHKSEDMHEAVKLKQYLERCFIKTWLDNDDLKGGDALASSFIKGAKGSTSIALVSEKYLNSNWCENEFKRAYNNLVTKKADLILAIIGNENDASIIKQKAEEKGWNEFASYMENHKYLLFNIYDTEKSCKEIAFSVQRQNPIKFKALKQIEIKGQPLQYVDFEIQTDAPVPLEVFQTWQVNLMDFMDFNDDNKPIKKEIPIAFPAQGPCWFYAYISTPFANKHEVFVHLKVPNKFLCVYARNTNREMMGKVIEG